MLEICTLPRREWRKDGDICEAKLFHSWGTQEHLRHRQLLHLPWRLVVFFTISLGLGLSRILVFRRRKQKRLATVELNHSIITATKKGSLIDDISCHRSLLEAGLFFDKYVWFVIIVDVYSTPHKSQVIAFP